MYEDIQALLSEIAAGEDTFLELKEAVFRGNQILIGDAGRAAPEIAEVFCSIANTQGGVVVFGIRKDGAVAGIPAEKRDLLEQFVINVGLNNCRPMIEPVLNWMQLPDENQMMKLCLKVDIPLLCSPDFGWPFSEKSRESPTSYPPGSAGTAAGSQKSAGTV
jgi:predicted HTH transcriptional regulator